MELTVDSEDLDSVAFNQIVRIAQSGKESEVFKDAEESWVLYVVSLFNSIENGYPEDKSNKGAKVHHLHRVLVNTDYAPFTDTQDSRERERIEGLLEELKENSIVKQPNERWMLDSTEI